MRSVKLAPALSSHEVAEQPSIFVSICLVRVSALATTLVTTRRGHLGGRPAHGHHGCPGGRFGPSGASGASRRRGHEGCSPGSWRKEGRERGRQGRCKAPSQSVHEVMQRRSCLPWLAVSVTHMAVVRSRKNGVVGILSTSNIMLPPPSPPPPVRGDRQVGIVAGCGGGTPLRYGGLNLGAFTWGRRTSSMDQAMTTLLPPSPSNNKNVSSPMAHPIRCSW